MWRKKPFHFLSWFISSSSSSRSCSPPPYPLSDLLENLTAFSSLSLWWMTFVGSILWFHSWVCGLCCFGAFLDGALGCFHSNFSFLSCWARSSHCQFYSLLFMKLKSVFSSLHFFPATCFLCESWVNQRLSAVWISLGFRFFGSRQQIVSLTFCGPLFHVGFLPSDTVENWVASCSTTSCSARLHGLNWLLLFGIDFSVGSLKASILRAPHLSPTWNNTAFRQVQA